jgi:hypothetical protein
MKRLDSFLTRAALKRLLSEVEKQQRRPPSPTATRTRLNFLNTGVMVDLDAARKLALSQIAAYLRRSIR